ncbi:hypothetical protein DFJ74DRAFT_744365 [Hyaloraphidium curvatum]|nr:hypothetical protein DFJ74DRAFT_744365 [Hyaloraphidium curvatum]
MAAKKVLIITGGSRGIGAAVARLAAPSFNVALTSNANKEAAEALLPSLRSHGNKAMAVRCDVASEDDVVGLFRAVESELGPVTHLCNSAGILGPISRLDAMDAKRIEDVFRTNVLGTFLCCREAVRRMSTAKGGRGGAIVNLSSAAARLGSPFEFVDYASSKGAIDTLTIGLAKEVAREGIRVNAVRPGLIATDIHASAGAPDRVERLAAGVPIGRGGTAEEVAHSIMYLLDDVAASYVTGAILDVAGGR